MDTQSVAADLRPYVAALSPAQRHLLAQRLQSLGGTDGLPAGEQEAQVLESAPPTPQLVAYIVAANGAPDTADLRARLRAYLPEYMVPAQLVVLSALPRTPNGKLDQSALPAPARKGEGSAAVGSGAAVERGAAAAAPMGEAVAAIEARLADIWAQVLGFTAIAADDNFFEVGGDSILSIQIVARAAQAGLRLAPDDLFQHQTIAALARVVAARRTDAPTAASAQTTGGQQAAGGSGTAPLTPIQHWFFGLRLAEPQHWNQALLLSAQFPLEEEHLAAALRHLVRRHDALRLSFRQTGPADGTGCGWEQQVASPDGAAQPFVGGFVLPADGGAQEEALADIAAKILGGFDLASGCLLRAALLRSSEEDLVLLALHHLAIDAIGLGILVEELALLYRQVVGGRAVVLPAPTVSYRDWALALAHFAGAAPVREELAFWRQMLAAPTARLPRDVLHQLDGNSAGADAGTEGSTDLVTVKLPADETVILLHRKSAGSSPINDLLLAALALTISEWCGHAAIRVGLEGHGRESGIVGADASRSVGWFTSYFVAVLQLGADRTPPAVLRTIHDQLARIPQRGIGYGLLRYLTAEGEQVLRGLPDPELLFNYLGQFDRSHSGWDFLARREAEIGPLRSPHNRRHHLLECNAVVLNGSLHLRWEYSRTWHQRATVERLAARFLHHLHTLLAPGDAPTAAYTPADFPEANLSQAELDDLLAGLAL